MTFFGGSSWSSCYLCETSQGKKVFAKTARGRKSEDMFLGEYLGLKAMFGADSYVFFNAVYDGTNGDRIWFDTYMQIQGRFEFL